MPLPVPSVSSQLDFYEAFVQPLYPIALDMHERGIKISQDRLDTMLDECTESIKLLQSELKDKIGFIPNTKSFLDMKRLFDLFAIKYNTTKTGRPAIGEIDMLHYAHKYQSIRGVIQSCMEMTGYRTTLSTFQNIATDSLGFYHPLMFLNGTETGRFTSKGAEEGGPQIQNWSMAARRIAIPDDERCEFTQADLKGADAQCVAALSGDPLMLKVFEERKDLHQVRGCMIYLGWRSESIPPDEMINQIERVCQRCSVIGLDSCKHSRRHLSKEMGHGSAYGLGPRSLAMTHLPKSGIFISESEVRHALACIITPSIRKWHERIKRSLSVSPRLYNPFGRCREFFSRLDSSGAVIREALAWEGSSPVSDLVNLSLIRLFKMLEQPARIVTTTHDSILLCHLKHQRDQVVDKITEAFDTTMAFGDRKLKIAVDIKHSDLSWGNV